MSEERDFKGVWIDKSIWLDDRLNAVEKIILTEIDSLNTEKGCYASNEYLADFCQCSVSKVSKTIKKLIELGYIYIESFDGRYRVLRSRVVKNAMQNSEKCYADYEKITTNNIINNKVTNKEDNIYSAVCSYLNEKTGFAYRSTTGATQRLIRARQNEGFTLDDFQKVIDNKCAEWLNTDMQKYLRPETLFGTKFESYLNSGKKEKEKFVCKGGLNL